MFQQAPFIHLQTLQNSPVTPPGCGVPRAPAPRPCWRLRRVRRATTSPSLRASLVPTTRSTPCQSRLPAPPLTSVLAALPGRTKVFQCIAADNLKVGTCLTNLLYIYWPVLSSRGGTTIISAKRPPAPVPPTPQSTLDDSMVRPDLLQVSASSCQVG